MLAVGVIARCVFFWLQDRVSNRCSGRVNSVFSAIYYSELHFYTVVFLLCCDKVTTKLPKRGYLSAAAVSATPPAKRRSSQKEAQQHQPPSSRPGNKQNCCRKPGIGTRILDSFDYSQWRRNKGSCSSSLWEVCLASKFRKHPTQKSLPASK